jgi:lipoprotein-releasing system ATP-binding protein
LITRPQLLLADEPTGDLDMDTATSIFELLERMHHQHGLTSLIVTHNHAFARRCQRVLRMAKSGVEEVAPESLVAG